LEAEGGDILIVCLQNDEIEDVEKSFVELMSNKFLNTMINKQSLAIAPRNVS
jgi:hypothetical protein